MRWGRNLGIHKLWIEIKINTERFIEKRFCPCFSSVSPGHDFGERKWLNSVRRPHPHLCSPVTFMADQTPFSRQDSSVWSGSSIQIWTSCQVLLCIGRFSHSFFSEGSNILLLCQAKSTRPCETATEFSKFCSGSLLRSSGLAESGWTDSLCSPTLALAAQTGKAPRIGYIGDGKQNTIWLSECSSPLSSSACGHIHLSVHLSEPMIPT